MRLLLAPQSTNSVFVRDLCHIINRLTASIQAVLPAPLQYRNLQKVKNLSFSQTQGFNASVTDLRKELSCWMDNLDSWNGRSVQIPHPDMTLETDASLPGWGAVKDKISTNDLWFILEIALNINILELKAGEFVVKNFASSTRNIHIHLRMGNKTTVHQQDGGTWSFALTQQDCQLWQWCLQKEITLSAEYLPEIDNCTAECKLNKEVFFCIISIMGSCSVNVCNMPKSQAQTVRQLKTGSICSSHRCPDAQLERKRSLCLPTILPDREMSAEGARGGGNIAAHSTHVEYTAMVQYPVLLDLLITHPLLLLRKSDLLMDIFDQSYPGYDLQLAAWKISGVNTKVWAYQELPALSRQVEQRHQCSLPVSLVKVGQLM